LLKYLYFSYSSSSFKSSNGICNFCCLLSYLAKSFHYFGTSFQ